MPLFGYVAFGLAGVFGLTAIAALVWAITSGQFRDFGVGAESIFDEQEPVGTRTDAFTGSAAEGDEEAEHG